MRPRLLKVFSFYKLRRTSVWVSAARIWQQSSFCSKKWQTLFPLSVLRQPSVPFAL
jgi:hypothetical protein